MQETARNLITYGAHAYAHGLTLPLNMWFVAAADDAGARCVRDSRGRVDSGAAGALIAVSDEVIAFSTLRDDTATDEVVVRRGEHVIYLLPCTDGSAGIIVASPTPDAARRELRYLIELLRPAVPEQLSVKIRMWHASMSGFESHLRSIHVRPLDDVDRGMSAGAREAVRRVRAVGATGGVHVWHGPPGCGKTTAIRSLAQAWCEGTTLEVILDPATFLAKPAYMLAVLKAHPAQRTFDVDGEQPPPGNRVLVLEDAGEAVTADAAERTGNGMSRLLNLTDGMFGDDERPTIIITTNEPVRKLHRALVRPGRCRSVIEFGPLEPDEANDWLLEHGCAHETVTEPMTIAELAALTGDGGVDHAHAEIAQLGFA